MDHNDNDKVLTVFVWADVDPSQPQGAETHWIAKTAATQGPLVGLFAHGETFPAARQALAGTILDAAKAQGLCADIAAVRVLAMTRKTFPVATLAGQEPS